MLIHVYKSLGGINHDSMVFAQMFFFTFASLQAYFDWWYMLFNQDNYYWVLFMFLIRTDANEWEICSIPYVAVKTVKAQGLTNIHVFFIFMPMCADSSHLHVNAVTFHRSVEILRIQCEQKEEKEQQQKDNNNISCS